jgi:3-hexulose-6-phosphate synthase
MRLQVALDRLDKEQCIKVVDAVESSIDIIEVGTGVINEFGLSLVRDIKKQYPDKLVLADLKICDAGDSESRNAFDYGADIITVMSFADTSTIKACLKNATEYKREVVVDMLNNQDAATLHELSSIGVKNISLHIGKDQQDRGAVTFPLTEALKAFNFGLYVAGGINEQNLETYLQLQPKVVIVGSGITKSQDMAASAKRLKEKINTF